LISSGNALHGVEHIIFVADLRAQPQLKPRTCRTELPSLVGRTSDQQRLADEISPAKCKAVMPSIRRRIYRNGLGGLKSGKS